MVPVRLRSLVAENAEWFSGVQPESDESLDEAECRLGISLPESLRWLLTEYGYSSACGIASLDLTVEGTLRCRSSIGLPVHYVLLDDRGDAGVVLLDAATPVGRVVWVGAHEVLRLASGEEAKDLDEFSDFTSWISRCLEDSKGEADA